MLSFITIKVFAFTFVMFQTLPYLFTEEYNSIISLRQIYFFVFIFTCIGVKNMQFSLEFFFSFDESCVSSEIEDKVYSGPYVCVMLDPDPLVVYILGTTCAFPLLST